MASCGPDWTSTTGFRETGSSGCPAGPRSGHHSSIQLPELERMGTMSGTAGVLQTAPLGPPCAPAPPERGASVTTSSPLHTGIPYWTVFLLTCFLLQQVPPHNPGGSAHGDLMSTVPSDQGPYRLALPFTQLPQGSAAGRGWGDLCLYNAGSVHHASPLRGMQTRSSSYPGSLESCVYWDEKCGGPVKERTGGSDLKTLVSRIRAGFVLTEHFTCQWNGDSDWLLGSGEPHQLRSNSHKSIKEIRTTPLVSFKSFLIQKKKNPTNQCMTEGLWNSMRIQNICPLCPLVGKATVKKMPSASLCHYRRQIFMICSVPGPRTLGWTDHLTARATREGLPLRPRLQACSAWCTTDSVCWKSAEI